MDDDDDDDDDVEMVEKALAMMGRMKQKTLNSSVMVCCSMMMCWLGKICSVVLPSKSLL